MLTSMSIKNPSFSIPLYQKKKRKEKLRKREIKRREGKEGKREISSRKNQK